MEGITIFLIVSAWLIVFGAFGGYVSIQVGREPAEGLILGALFGPLGVIVAALLPADPMLPSDDTNRTFVDPRDAEDDACRDAIDRLTRA